MKVLIDADACPVVDITTQLCLTRNMPCMIFSDTAHEIHKPGATTLVFDKGADSVDFAIVNKIEPGDIVITQDYGLASMCMAKSARILHQDGWEYSQNNIDALLFQRHTAREFRAAGGRTKGPSKRKPAQDEAFRSALLELLQTSSQG